MRGKPIFRKVGPTTVRELCVRCGKHPQKKKPGGKFKALCSSCDRKVFENPDTVRAYKKKYNATHIDTWRRPYRKHVKNVCSKCGFTSEHLCQFDVDHIDGNHKNNSEENLQTLCANCHRLKTQINKEWIKQK